MVQVKVSEGTLEGETVTSEYGDPFHSFKGIPYATPPVGELRFQPPLPPKPWEGVRSAKEHGNKCHQFNFVTRIHEEHSEDCLYLNVYTPEIKPAKPLPVMIFIHGGAFCCGSGDDDMYGPEYLIRHGVILVTFNYRLEVLGFLCLDTPEVPGNAGIKDQVAAMRWVKNNISNFGGDPENITIFGQSSGGVCVTYHCVSPMTKGLFKRAIAQSGSMTAWWALAYRPRERAIAFARKMGFKSEDDKELYEFFKKQPAKNILEVQMSVTFAEKIEDKLTTQFMVVSEKKFPGVEPYFTGDIMEALKNDIHEGIDLIIGYNQDDGAVCMSVGLDMNMTIDYANNYKEYFVPRQMARYCSIDDQLEIGKKFREFYAQKQEISLDNFEPIVKYYTAEHNKFNILQLAKCFAHKKHKVYLYKFTCHSERNFYGAITGMQKYIKGRKMVSHIDDLPYLFPHKMINQKVSINSDTFKLINGMSKMWTNFAKCGNPTPDATLGINWRVFRNEAQYFLELGNKLTRAVGLDKEEISFWEEVYSQYLPSKMFRKDEESKSSPGS